MIGQLIGGAPIGGSEQGAADGGITGDLAAIESGSDTLVSTGVVVVSGALSATESGSDSLASTGSVLVSGLLSATEAGSDTFAAVGGSVVVTSGTLDATESGSDTFAASGVVPVAGSLSATESGSDTLAADGGLIVSGALAATEAGSDTFAAIGFGGSVAGDLNATEEGSDTFFATNVEQTAGGMGFVLTNFESKLWWKRKPKALPEEQATEQVKRVVKAIERVAKTQIEQPQPFKAQKAEVREAIAPMVEQMPGFDWMAVYTAILDGLKRQQAEQMAKEQIARIQAMRDEDEDLLVLMMGML